MKCLFCDKRDVLDFYFCDYCKSDSFASYFEVFDLPFAYAISLSTLDDSYSEKMSRIHPDNFLKPVYDDYGYAGVLASLLNEAYKSLKDPVLRANYMLSTSGCPVDSVKLSQEFLLEMMELSEGEFDIGELKARCKALLASLSDYMCSGSYPDGARVLAEYNFIKRRLEQHGQAN